MPHPIRLSETNPPEIPDGSPSQPPVEVPAPTDPMPIPSQPQA